jgi:hypothetical protein
VIVIGCPFFWTAEQARREFGILVLAELRERQFSRSPNSSPEMNMFSFDISSTPSSAVNLRHQVP